MRIDLHTHSDVSDGTDSPAALIRAAAGCLDVVALTDHDSFAGLVAAQAAAVAAGIMLVPGLEMSTTLFGKSVHLLGYFCDLADAELGAELAKIRAGRRERMPKMLARLQGLGLEIDGADLAQASVPGRPHVADALIRLGVVPDRQTAFERYLSEGRPAFVPKVECPLERGISLILGAGGVPVLAHPWGRGGTEVLPPVTMARLVADHGLAGIEVDHQDHDPATRVELRELAARLDLIVTGSSDYHGTGKVGHDLGVNLTDPNEYRRLLARAGR